MNSRPSESSALGRDHRPPHDHLARRRPNLGPRQRPPERDDLRARLGHPIARRDRDPGAGRALQQRSRDRPAPEQHPPQRRRPRQPRVEQPREHRRHQRHERDPPRRVHQIPENPLGVKPPMHHRGGRIDRAADRDRQPADVGQRHRAQPPLGRIQPQRDRRPQRVGEPVASREHDLLGRRGGPGRVHHRHRGIAGRASPATRSSSATGARSAPPPPRPSRRARSSSVSRRSTGTATAPARTAAVQRDHEVLDRRQRQRDAVAIPHAHPLQRPRDPDRRLRHLRVGQAPRRSLDRDSVRVLGSGQVDPDGHDRNGNLGRPHKEHRIGNHLGLGR